ISWAEVGNVHLFSKNPIYKVSDLSRLKVWTWSGDPLSKETFLAMGANPIPLAITDVTTALNTGMVDTVYAPPLGALALQWYRYVNYMTSLPLAHSTGAVLLSVKTSNRMGRDLLELTRREFDHTMALLMSELRKQGEEAIDLMEAGGLKTIPVPQGNDLKDFYSIHDKVAKKLVGKVYPRELLDRVYEILRRSRQQ
ncbi:MAG: TRAP transporter substrate-binding protein DctP, partial [Deltaproteobacteria bacterium]|nr:TRAP transporter substrate-binding protein DctP [Deltaproteobacteria bacterium]